jgi:ubiquinone/menaquinone biosynthesis C-methylase UbiE
MMRSTSPFAQHSGPLWRAFWRRDLFSRTLIRHLGGFTPGLEVDWTRMQAVLDVGCGTGAWATMLARRYPHLDVLGIDADPEVLEMARTLTFTHEVTTARFLRQDVRTLDESSLPLDHFDLVHLAFLAEAILSVDYAALARALLRLLRPGGVLVWTEAEFPLTISAACERLFALTLQALDHAGQTFLMRDWGLSSQSLLDRSRTFLGITPMLGSWLRATGYEYQQQTVAALDVSHGQPLHSQFVNAVLEFARRIQPFLLRHDVIKMAACEQLCEEVYRELRAPGFSGMAYVLTVSASKPVAEDRHSRQAIGSSSEQEGGMKR